MSSVELSFAIYLGQRLTCYSLCNFTCLAFHVSNIKSTNSKTDWLMWSLDIDLSRPTSNFYSTSNIAFTWSFDNMISKISIWHIHTFGLKRRFYGWMLFLTPTLINSAGKLAVFPRDTISQMAKSQNPGTRQTKNQNPDTAEGIYRPLLGLWMNFLSKASAPLAGSPTGFEWPEQED